MGQGFLHQRPIALSIVLQFQECQRKRSSNSYIRRTIKLQFAESVLREEIFFLQSGSTSAEGVMYADSDEIMDPNQQYSHS